MIEFPELTLDAYTAELRAARKLSERTGIDAEQALRTTLEQAAGIASLPVLLAARAALRDADAARAKSRLEQRAQGRLKQMTRHEGAPTAWRGWFDGSAHPNPGRCGIGALLTGPAGQQVELSRPAGYASSSEAEYLALIALLEAAVSLGAVNPTIFGDSRVVIDDVAASDAAGAATLHAYRHQARGLMAQLGDVTLRWLPRHKNQAADALSQQAIANWVGSGD